MRAGSLRTVGFAPVRVQGAEVADSRGRTRPPRSRRLLHLSAADMYDRFSGGRERALRMLERAFETPGNLASAECVWVADVNGEIGAAMAAFPVDEAHARSRAFLRLTLQSAPVLALARHAAALPRRRPRLPEPARAPRSTSTRWRPTSTCVAAAPRGRCSPRRSARPARSGCPASRSTRRCRTRSRAPSTRARASTRWRTGRRAAACRGSSRSSSPLIDGSRGLAPPGTWPVAIASGRPA